MTAMPDIGPAEAIGKRAAAARLQVLNAHLARGIDLFAFIIGGVLLVFLVVVLSLQVFFRYVLESGIPWSEEAARFALVWLTFAAAAMAAYRGDHFIFRWGTLLLPPRGRFWLRRAVDVVVVLFLLMLLAQSLIYLDIVAHKRSSGLGLNMRVPLGGIAFGAGILLLLYITELVDAALRLVTGRSLSLRERKECGDHGLMAAAGTGIETP